MSGDAAANPVAAAEATVAEGVKKIQIYSSSSSSSSARQVTPFWKGKTISFGCKNKYASIEEGRSVSFSESSYRLSIKMASRALSPNATKRSSTGEDIKTLFA
ncbi:hypothetical protein C4D60_Mb08t09100 [Musa balbisiana]|uniref:Uncharacterized protein n=1 Tax=Musa balbisiana TaxID=52838 RepID=A0A4S8K2F1_MUSBA|nr:hypothetical protein C4D60_Mb08t09100 [Musa balbisiana]